MYTETIWLLSMRLPHAMLGMQLEIRLFHEEISNCIFTLQKCSDLQCWRIENVFSLLLCISLSLQVYLEMSQVAMTDLTKTFALKQGDLQYTVKPSFNLLYVLIMQASCHRGHEAHPTTSIAQSQNKLSFKLKLFCLWNEISLLKHWGYMIIYRV